MSAEEDKKESQDDILLAGLLSSLSFQALGALGKFSLKEGETPEINLDLAKNTIDIIDVLLRKLSGQIRKELESHAVSSLASLNMEYVQTLKSKEGKTDVKDAPKKAVDS